MLRLPTRFAQLAHDFRAGLQRVMGGDVGFAAVVESGPSRGADRYVHTHVKPVLPGTSTFSASASAGVSTPGATVPPAAPKGFGSGEARIELVGDVDGECLQLPS